MKYKVITTRNFEKEAKRLIKKFPSLKKELLELNSQLLLNPEGGIPIGKHAFKIRLAVKSKGKGKSGGMRVITYIELDFFIENSSNIYLLSIYDKSETATISNDELKRLIESISR
jgi:mRNA-degrading endonuclease RelE of RelBE toxin-antitoxin system